MKEIIINNQSEWDALPTEFAEFTIVKIVGSLDCINRQIINGEVHMRGSAKISYMRGSAQIIYMRDSAQISDMRGSAKISDMSGSAKIIYMSGSAQISYMRDSAQISYMSGSAKISYMRGSAQISYMSGSAQISDMRDSATISDMSDSATISYMSGSAQISDMRGSAKISDMRDSAQISYMSGSAQISRADDTTVVCCYGDFAPVLYGFAVAIIYGKAVAKKASKGASIVRVALKYDGGLMGYLGRHNIKPKNGNVILYKRVSVDFKTQENTDNETIWAVGSTLEYSSWNPTGEECGPGKFHACAFPWQCDLFRKEKQDDRYVAIEIATCDLHAWDNPTYKHKIAFRMGTVLHECDRDGNKIETSK